MRALLDVNVLVALLDADHIHHVTARNWLQANIAEGWASCAITQNGCIRILSQPNYPNAIAPAAIAARLREASEAPFHHYWTDMPSLLSSSLLDWQFVHGSAQTTNAYLLSLAVHHGGRLVTFDHSVPRRAVPSAGADHLLLL
jgi:toxin-antitoxin system PIN domain toxin